MEQLERTISPLVQYVIIRKDLITKLKWPVGAVIAQACHASIAVIHTFYEENNTQEYLKELDRMHKIVLEVPDEPVLQSLSTKLREDHIKHKLWIEEPENIPTCIVLMPYQKEKVQKYFRKLQLFKGQ